MSKRSVFSTVTSGSRISCWCSLFGKYCSRLLPLSLNAPVPGSSRTRTMASLRRPTVWMGRSGSAAGTPTGATGTSTSTSVGSAASVPSVVSTASSVGSNSGSGLLTD
jgi:hypothetical protein